jgi:hypothetical protein
VPQNSVQGFTDIVGTFELYFAKQLIHKTVDETNCYAQQYKNSRGNISSKQLKAKEWQSVTIEEIYNVLALLILMRIVQKPSLSSYFSWDQLAAMPIFGSVIYLNRF